MSDMSTNEAETEGGVQNNPDRAQSMRDALKGGSKGDMAVKKEGHSGLHKTSASVGKVVSDSDTDAEGNGPEDLRQTGEDDEGVLGKASNAERRAKRK